MTPNFRLQLLFFRDNVPDEQEVLDTVSQWSEVESVYLARRTAASERANQWTRDPLNMLPFGRMAVDFRDHMPHQDQTRWLSQAFDASAYICRSRWPLPPPLNPGETFAGTLQLCCFRRLADLSDADLKTRWLDQHTPVALETQSTQGYVQNLVWLADFPHFDGIVEEYFLPESATSVEHFFDAVGDVDKLKANVARMTGSTARFLDLDGTEVIHLTDTRLI